MSRHYAEALQAMKTVDEEESLKFIALAWQGMLLDLLGRRGEAVTAYQAALAIPGTPRYRHTINGGSPSIRLGSRNG